MNKSMRYVFIAFAILVCVIGGYFLVDYLIDSKDKKDFISSSQEIYKLALENKTTEIKYFDSEFNKLSDSKLNYHIEFNGDSIIYFLAYDDEHLIEIEEMNVTEKDFESDKNYSDLTSDNLISTIKYKQDSMNAKYVNNISEYNNSLEDDNENTLPEENNETENQMEKPTPIEEPTNPSTNDEEKEETKYTVSFSANGGNGGQTSAVTVKYNELMPAINKTKPTRSGYTFMGYYDNNDYTKGKVYYNEVCEAAKYYDKKGNITLYAGWKKNTTAVVTPTTPTQDVITYNIESKPYCKNVVAKGYTESEENGSYVYTVHMGRVPNGCYAINIKKVVMDNNNNAIIYVENVYPSVTSICTQAIAYPCASVKFSAKPNSIKVIESDKYSEPTPSTPENPSSNNSGSLTYKIDKSSYCSIKRSGVTTEATSEGYKVIIGMGERKTGGYSVNVDNVDIDSSNNVVITAHGSSPAATDMTTQAITYPCAIITFNKEPNSLKYNLSGLDSNNSFLPTK